MPQQLDRSILEIALVGLESQRDKINDQIKQVKAFLGGGPAQTTAAADASEAPTGKRKKFSAATRRKMAEARHRRKEKNLELKQKTIPFAEGQPVSSN